MVPKEVSLAVTSLSKTPAGRFRGHLRQTTVKLALYRPFEGAVGQHHRESDDLSCPKRRRQKPVLDKSDPVYFLETFVDPERFRGTCYRAANWVLLGKTTGRGKQSNSYVPNRSIKEILGYPLSKRFRERLGE